MKLQSNPKLCQHPLESIEHDAAVAHALMRAIGLEIEACEDTFSAYDAEILMALKRIENGAAEILREEFGINETALVD